MFVNHSARVVSLRRHRRDSDVRWIKHNHSDFGGGGGGRRRWSRCWEDPPGVIGGGDGGEEIFPRNLRQTLAKIKFFISFISVYFYSFLSQFISIHFLCFFYGERRKKRKSGRDPVRKKMLSQESWKAKGVGERNKYLPGKGK